MATIQVRDIPEESYEVIRRRARAEGRSIQSYMRELVIEHTAYADKMEAIKRLEAVMANGDSPWATREQILADLDADRSSR